MRRIVSVALCAALLLTALSGCGGAAGGGADTNKLGNGWAPEHSMDVQYAENFAVDYYEGGYTLLSVSDGTRYLLLPEGAEAPAGIDPAITLLPQPVNNIYLVATSSMCLFDALGTLDSIRLSGTKAEDWYIEGARAAMEVGDILYAGKYDTPDYELILSSGCELAVESTMIGHAPEVKEKLEELGVPVLVDRSSYESHPLGRTEWIKFYAALTGQEALAEQLFAQQVAYVDAVAGQESTGKTVAFFYISSSGYVVARKSGDYVTRMIELAGGDYIFKNLGDDDTATSTVTLEMETFYATAKDADYIIYNSTIGGEMASMEEFVSMSNLLGEFKAVREGNVWCTGKNLFQETTQLGLMISDIHEMLVSGDPGLNELNFLYKLE